MSKFKVGDRVAFISPDMSPTLENEFTVIAHDDDGDPILDDHQEPLYCGHYDSHLRLIERHNGSGCILSPDHATFTRRDYFAMAALTGLLMMREYGTYEGRVSDAFTIADLMESARNKEGGE